MRNADVAERRCVVQGPNYMIQINVGDHSGSENNVPFLPIPEKWRDEVRWARKHAQRVSIGNPKADRYFRSLPRGRSLNGLLTDRSIWINYYNRQDVYGFTFCNNDLWLSDAAFAPGRWTVLATLIHELAHIGGAIGGASVCSVYNTPCHAAERAVFECGLGSKSEGAGGRDDRRTPYVPGLVG